jgi:hypothetical protein
MTDEINRPQSAILLREPGAPYPIVRRYFCGDLLPDGRVINQREMTREEYDAARARSAASFPPDQPVMPVR